ncbi:hypothetical protein BH23ACT11_BH23ACT11_04320 [soil metagenome]
MRTHAIVAIVLGLLTAAGSPGALAQQDNTQDKRAQTGMKFLQVSADPRAAGMASAITALEGGSSMLFYNPAGMARLETNADVMFGRTQWIAGIDYNFGSIAYRPFGGRYGVFGVSATYVDYGEIQETIRADNEQGFIDLGTFSPRAYSFGLGYAAALSDRFSLGGQVKYVGQNLGSSVMSDLGNAEYDRTENRQNVLAFDFGVLYKTGWESLNFAVSARNFAPEVTYEEESFELPLTLLIGVSMDLLDLYPIGRPDMHSLVVGLEAANPRDFDEQIKIGGEYTFMNTLAIRAGYVFPTDEEGFSVGAGLRQEFSGLRFGADYAFTSFGVFTDVHRIAVRLSF